MKNTEGQTKATKKTAVPSTPVVYKTSNRYGRLTRKQVEHAVDTVLRRRYQ